MPKYLNCVVVYLFVCISLNTYSQEIITDRPDQTESAVAVPRGILQLETGMGFEHSETERKWIFNTSLFRYGIMQNLELRLVTELQENRQLKGEAGPDLGIGDIQFGLKYQFLTGSFQVAYLGHVILPTGLGRLSKGTTGTHHRIAFAHQFADWIAVSCNLGIEHFHGEAIDGLYSLSLGFPLTDRIGFFTEIYGDWAGFENLGVQYDHGLTFLVMPNLQLDFSMGAGISSRSGFYSIGVSWYAPYQD